MTDHMCILALVGKARKEVAHAVETRAFLVIRFDDRPRRIGSVRVKELCLFRFGVVVPFIDGLAIDRRQLPLLQRLVLAGLEAQGPALPASPRTSI